MTLDSQSSITAFQAEKFQCIMYSADLLLIPYLNATLLRPEVCVCAAWPEPAHLAPKGPAVQGLQLLAVNNDGGTADNQNLVHLRQATVVVQTDDMDMIGGAGGQPMFCHIQWSSTKWM